MIWVMDNIQLRRERKKNPRMVRICLLDDVVGYERTFSNISNPDAPHVPRDPHW
jgi:hypothetical protein